MRRSRALLSTVMMLAMLTPALAGKEEARQTRRGGSPEEHARRIVDRLDRESELGDDQRQELIPIFTEHARERDELISEMRSRRESEGSTPGRGDREAMHKMRGKMEKLREKLETRIEPVLSEEQMQAYRKLAEARRAEMRSRMEERGGPPQR